MHGETEAKEAGRKGLAFFEGDGDKAGDTAFKSTESLDTAESVASTEVTDSKARERRLDFRQRFRKNPKRFLFCGMAALFFILAIATAVLLYVDHDTEAAVRYETAAVTTKTVDRTLTAAGEVTYADTETVSFSTSKTFQATCVETNDAVVTGQKLAEYSNGTYLTADCKGVIAEINAPETGATATSSHYITIYPTDELILDITVPQDEINMVVNGNTNTVYEGKITYLNGAASGSLSSDTSSNSSESSETTESSGGGSEAAGATGEDTSTSGGSNGSSATSTDSGSTAYFEVIISVDNDGNLKLGMGANCRIMLESKEDVIAVPVEAIYFNDAARYVYLVGEDGSVTKQAVETGISDAHYVEITVGLTGDETVRVEKIG